MNSFKIKDFFIFIEKMYCIPSALIVLEKKCAKGILNEALIATTIKQSA